METIMLLPAAATTSRIWGPVADALGDRFRVLTPDLPGHGDVPGPFTMERAAADVTARLDEAPGPVHLVGLSLSVTVAVLAALARPDRVRSLVLSGGVAHPPPALALQRAIVAAMPERLIGRVLTKQLEATVGSAGLVAGCAADFAAIGKRTYRAALRELAHTDLRDRLGALRVPTLVLCGAHDRVNLPASRDLAARIDGAELRVVPDAVHLWNLQFPDLFARTLAGFADR